MDCSDLKLAWARVEQSISDAKELIAAKKYEQARPVLLDIYEDIKEMYIGWAEGYEGLFEDFRYPYSDAMIYVCSQLAFCFNEVEDYASAYYYGAWAGESGDYTAFLEWVNCLVNSNHPEAFIVVRRYCDDMEALKELFGDEPELIEHANNFLARRLAYLYVENGYFTSARELLEKLKERPSCREFAEGELSYLDSLENGDEGGEEDEEPSGDENAYGIPDDIHARSLSSDRRRHLRRPRGLK